MVEKQDFDGAAQCFQTAEKCGVDDDGVLWYWYAVALIRSGNDGDAVTTLDKCIRANYEPTACLLLQALVNLQAQDFHAAAEQLQRALAIDAAQSRSLFNYALLMERMGNFEAQQQLLEYVFESRGNENYGRSSKELKSDGATKLPATAKTTDILFNEDRLASLLPSRLVCVNAAMVNFHLAVAAMENGCWLESKKHFEEFLNIGDFQKPQDIVVEATRDYVYVLLQCKLPSLALSKCEQYLLEHDTNSTNKDSVVVAKLLLHLYKADALLCLERADECYEYLKQTAQPMIQVVMQKSNDTQETHSIGEEIRSCHTQLLNNLAVVMACCSGVDSAILLLREGLQQYPDCLAIIFNLVLLLWRKGEEATACSMWFRARGWDLQSKTDESKSTPSVANSLDAVAAYENAAMSTSTFPTTPISEHVQGTFDGEGGVSAQQLVYLDALILNYYRKTRNAQLVDKSLQYVEYIESLGTASITQHN
ncbi:Hypothetical protein PHPALM_11327 [Phytophthora palmivora]|uniref:Uncharacterized protein n=1 Tax=Phytophthora palmivora TaxID=4796 RepID=A0A2P4Y2K6_9STRA|nr:Hypothetical protein PHPALM_11327 [Phytophthora palmivora]